MLAVAYGLLALGVVAFLISPLLDPQRRMAGEKPEVEDLLKKKDFLYAAIRELNIDYNMGKLSADDHKNLQHEYMQEASVVLDRLERSANGKQHIGARIEQAVLDMRKHRAASRSDDDASDDAPVPAPPAQAEVAAATVEGNDEEAEETPGKACTQCDTVNEADANFCIECGTPLVKRNCAACGAPYKTGAKFCAQCGHKLGVSG